MTGGAGEDIFYYDSSGANVISDYAEEDKISIASGTAETSTSGDDLIFTVGKGKISVAGSADKIVTYIDADGEHVYKKKLRASNLIQRARARRSRQNTLRTNSLQANTATIKIF